MDLFHHTMLTKLCLELKIAAYYSGCALYDVLFGFNKTTSIWYNQVSTAEGLSFPSERNKFLNLLYTAYRF